ncbi:MAG TPA: RecX family transcriptional regulator [Promineifilum sp.]
MTTQAKNPNRVNVFIDDEFACGLALEVALELRVGQVITRNDLEQLDKRDDVHRARERVLRLLARRPYSSAEIARYLQRHKIDGEIVQIVIEDLSEARLIDDEAFAAYWVEQRRAFRPRSRLALRQELGQKGIRQDIVNDALTMLDETAAARKIAQKQARRWDGLPEAEWRTRLTRYLMRHGYPYDVVVEVVAETWLALHTDEEE